jgi:hypothetical protein
MNRDLTHSRQVNHQAMIAGAEACEAMPSTTDRGWNPDGAGASDCALYIAYIETPRDQAWRPSAHAVPNRSGVVVPILAGTQQITFELPSK